MKKTSNSKDKKNVANYFLSEFENVLTSNGPEFFRRKKLFLKTFMYNIWFHSYNKGRAPTHFKCGECEVEFITATAYVSTHKKNT